MKCFLFAVLFVAGSRAASVIEDQTQHRDEKFLSIFQIVKFSNDACNATDGNIGTCFTAAECSANAGTATGNCASGFGVCCVAVVDSCSPYVQQNNSYLVNPGYPNGVSSSTCDTASSRQDSTAKSYVYAIKKATDDIVQFRFDFIKFETSSPSSGDCTNDTMSVSGADAVTTAILPTNLCGVVTSQHIYISVKDLGSNNLTLTISLSSSGDQTWNILVRQFSSSQTDYLAPRGCLQYFRSDTGTIATFNHNSGSGELLNNALYSVCIAQNDAMCDVTLTSSAFDLTGSSGSCSDAVAYGGEVACGATFGNSGTSTWNYTGPYCVTIKSDSDNSAMVAGASLAYTLLPC